MVIGKTGCMTENGKKSPSLKDLDERLKAAHARHAGQNKAPEGRGDGSGMAVGLRVMIDLLAGIVVGILIGYWMDRWLGTGPWLLVVFLFLGCAAGVMNVIRTARQIEERAAREKREAAVGRGKTPPDAGGDTG